MQPTAMRPKRVWLGALTICTLLAAACGQDAGAERTQLVASHQPALHALPTVIALDKGWFEELGLDVEMQVYASGAPQIEAGSTGEWSVGALGTVPMLIGASSYDMQMIGMSNDESDANAVYVRADVDTSDPQAVLQGSRILASTISTGEYALRACMQEYGVTADEVEIVNLEQSAILSASVGGEGDVFQYWAPFTYQAEEQADQKLLCTGADAGVAIPGAIIATQEAVESDPDAVTRWLAGYMRGMDFMRTNPDEALVYLRDYFNEQGIELSDESLRKEFELRPLLPVDEQIEWQTGTGADSAEDVMADIAQFFVDAGTLEEVPDPEDYIDPSFMKSVQEEYGDLLSEDG